MSRQRWKVGFFVEVEVIANEREAHFVAEAACGWPGDWRPPHDPVAVEGFIDGRLVTARIIRSQALTVTSPATSEEART